MFPRKTTRLDTHAGANFIHYAAGMLEDMSTIAYEQFVIDNDILGMAMRAVRSIEVNEETLALDVIDRGWGREITTWERTTQCNTCAQNTITLQMYLTAKGVIYGKKTGPKTPGPAP